MFPTYAEGRLQNIMRISVSIHALYKHVSIQTYTHMHTDISEGAWNS